MPAIDEEILRDLMRRSTGDLHAPSAVTADIVASHRRRRTRALGIAVTGVAAGTAFGLVAYASGAATGAGVSGGVHRATRLPALRLTAAQQTLYHLSSAAASAPQPTGRYAELAETQDSYKRTSVIDSRTGDTWTYQEGAGVPSELPVDRHGSPTEAQFAAMPTDPAALRALLLAQARQERAAGLRAGQQQLRKLGKAARKRVPEILSSGPQQTTGQEIFLQATDMLWNPLVGPTLRSALFKVLATTPGVAVNSDASDSLGRPAVEISQVNDHVGDGVAVFENPAATGVLELLFSYPNNGGSDHHDSDVFLSTTRTNAPPANPYQHS